MRRSRSYYIGLSGRASKDIDKAVGNYARILSKSIEQEMPDTHAKATCCVVTVSFVDDPVNCWGEVDEIDLEKLETVLGQHVPKARHIRKLSDW